MAKQSIALPVPHHSDGGTFVQAVGVSVTESEQQSEAGFNAYEHGGSDRYKQGNLVEAVPQKVMQVRKRII